jgi:hypothetical protein
MKNTFPNRRGFLRDLAAAAATQTLTGAPPPQPGSPIKCRIVDARGGNPLAARVRLLDTRGNEVVPLGHPSRLTEEAQEGDVRFQSRRYSYADGQFTVDPAWLPLRYQVLRGYEYVIAEGELGAAGVRDGALKIPITRWSTLAKDGWRSGDIHIHHIAPKTCRLEMDAEDLDVANILTSDFTKDQHEFEGKINAQSSRGRLIYVSQEYRNHQLGHMCLLNLKKLIEPVETVQPHHFPLHLDVCDRTHAQGGYVAWAHFPSWPGVECPLDVAMEKLDGLEILSVLDPRDFPVFMRELVPELAANNGLRLWYRFLNCGFRLTATAGTDKMTNYVTVGANRVFARVNGDFTYQGWIDALRAGRTFVTNSPVLHFAVNGKEPGATIQLDSKRRTRLQIQARAESQLPYDRLEIIANGEVIADATPNGERHSAQIRLEHEVTGSCWIAARAHESIDRYRSAGIEFRKVHSEKGPLLSSLYGTRRPEGVFAHSSPIYVIRDGQPVRSWDDAQYYVRYLDNAIRWLETQAKFASPSDRKSSIAWFQQGRAVYEKRALEAREHAAVQ